MTQFDDHKKQLADFIAQRRGYAQPDHQYIGDGSICPHCDYSGEKIIDASPAKTNNHFWCGRCGAGWIKLAKTPARHMHKSHVHETPCHITQDSDYNEVS